MHKVGISAPLVGDLNNDKKLDFISGSVVFLGNGDGTFKQIPLTIPAGNAVVALADLNGDGILDVVSIGGKVAGPVTVVRSTPGTEMAPSRPRPSSPCRWRPTQYQYSIAAGDVNGDGNPDLLVGEDGISGPNLAVFLGDGHGNFTADTNTYFISTRRNRLPATRCQPGSTIRPLLYPMTTSWMS